MESEIQLGRLAAAMAPRLIPLFAPRSTTVVRAPVEFEAYAVLKRALEVGLGKDVVAEVEVSQLVTDSSCTKVDAGWLLVRARDEVDLARLPRSSAHTVVVVSEGDARLPHSDDYHVFKANHLVARHEEAEQALGHLRPCDVFATMVASGGVPRLVVEALTDPDGLARTADAWAARIVDQVTDNWLTTMAVLTGCCSSEALAAMARCVTGVQVTVDEARQCLQRSWTTQWGRRPRWLPKALAAALVPHIDRRVAVPDTGLVLDRDHIAAEMVDCDVVLATERIRMLSCMAHWNELNQVLARRMPVLFHLERAELGALTRFWPEHPDPGLRSLAAARRVVVTHLQEPEGGEPRSRDTWWAAWRDLLLATDPGSEGSVLLASQGFARQIGSATRMLSLDVTKEVLSNFHSYLTPLVDHVLAINDSDRTLFDVMLVATHLCLCCDVALMIGDMDSLREDSNRAARLFTTVRVPDTVGGGLGRSVWARRAALAAVGGLSIVPYEQLASSPVLPTLDRAADALLAVGARFATLRPATEGTPLPQEWRDPHRPFAAFIAMAETLRLSLDQGHRAAIHWARFMVSMVEWSSVPGWEWWALEGTVVQLDALSGRWTQAEQRLRKAALPRLYAQALDALIDLMAGRPRVAMDKAQRLLAIDHLPPRWRLIALGIQIEVASTTPEHADQVDLLVSSEDWDSVLGAVTLFPPNARQLVRQHLTRQAAALPGIAEPAGEGLEAVKLTRRQLEVLTSLAEGLTLAEIASELVVGVETVRSTVKQLYRRLDVHDRASAVQVATRMGLLNSQV